MAPADLDERTSSPEPGLAGQLVCVGAIAGPFGVKGAVKIVSYCESPDAIGGYSPLFSEDGLVSYRIELTGTSGKSLTARLEGVENREQAARLQGTRLYADRSLFPTAGDEEFYLADLIGLEARDGDGVLLGHIRDVQNHGAGDFLDIKAEDGRDWLVPFSKETVPEVRIAEGLLVIHGNLC